MTTATIRHFCPSEGVIVVLREPLTVGTRDATSEAAAAWSRGTVLALTELWAERDERHQLYAAFLSGLRAYDLAGLRIHAPSEEAAIAAALEDRWADLDDRVDAWHAGEGDGQTLPEFLDMTEAEYSEWAADPATLPVPEGWVCLEVDDG